jgi:hypothetical protein
MAGPPDPVTAAERFQRRLSDIEDRLKALEHRGQYTLNEMSHPWTTTEGLTSPILDIPNGDFAVHRIGVIPVSWQGHDVFVAKAFVQYSSIVTNGQLFVRLEDQAGTVLASAAATSANGATRWYTLQYLHPWKTDPDDARYKPDSTSVYRDPPPDRLYLSYQRPNDGGNFSVRVFTPATAKWGDPQFYPSATSIGIWFEGAT